MKQVIAFAMAMALIACKPTTESSVQSLDNLAAGETINKNQCSLDRSGNYEPKDHPAIATILPPMGKYAQANATELIKTAKAAVSSVPVDLQGAFLAANGQILITDMATEYCTNEVRDSAWAGQIKNSQVEACAVFFTASKKNAQVLTILVSPKVESVQHNVVRLFGEIVANLLPRLAANSASLEAVEKFEGPKMELAVAFIEDMDKGPFDFPRLADIFGQQAFEDILERLRKQDYSDAEEFFAKVSFGGKSENEERDLRNRALNLVYTDAFDSYYCNRWQVADKAKLKKIRAQRLPIKEIKTEKNSRAIMAVIFPETYREFNEFTAQATRKMIKQLEFQAKGEGGYGLTGNPYWAGTKAFFGSIWDNTGGAAGRAYSSYNRSVQQVASRTDFDGSYVSTTARILGGTAKKEYGEYYDRKYEQTAARIDAMQRGGMDTTTAASYGVGLAVGDITGVTPAAEATYGVEMSDPGRIGQDLSTYDRVQRGAAATSQLAGTAAGVVGFTRGAAANAGRGSTYTIPKKKSHKMQVTRGWSDDVIRDTIDNPSAIGRTRYSGKDPNIPQDPATAYFRDDGHYIVRNNRTGTVYQGSDMRKTIVQRNPQQGQFAVDPNIQMTWRQGNTAMGGAAAGGSAAASTQVPASSPAPVATQPAAQPAPVAPAGQGGADQVIFN